MRKGFAFTLIELLVVVAIIAVLISILVPSLKAAKRSAKKALCASNFHQTGLATMYYVHDFDGYLPDAHWEHRAIHDWSKPVGFGRLLEYFPGSPTFLPDGAPFSDRGIFSCPEPYTVYASAAGGTVNWASIACLIWYQSELGGGYIKTHELSSGAALGSGWIAGNPFTFGSITGSLNHQRDGCNILYLDTSVDWRTSAEIKKGADRLDDFSAGWSCRYVQLGFNRD